MFQTYMGPVQDDASVVYFRPETAQGSYVNFKNVQQSSRKKIPFGIAQIGKSFRNEISPGNFVFRMREFEQMEMQYFVRPDEAAAIFEEWLPRRFDWYTRYGVTPSRRNVSVEAARFHSSKIAAAAWDRLERHPASAVCSTHASGRRKSARADLVQERLRIGNSERDICCASCRTFT